MKWPRGKYNGRRIVGFRVNIRVTVDFWSFRYSWNFGMPFVQIGPIRLGFELEYH